MNKLSNTNTLDTPNTCGECKYYKKYRDRCIDHVSCILGSYDDGDTPYDINYDNSRHCNCVIVQQRAMAQLKEWKRDKDKKKLLRALQEYYLKQFDEVKYKSINDIGDIVDLLYFINDNNDEVQLSFDCNKLVQITYVNKVVINKVYYNTINDFINDLYVL